ncbi:prepilin-type N-terminal cleavage/methylation domain-containing protein [Ureibacillus thermophilus]|uniref:Prepilin-type N-terminal cleavage/methylation domain-containing protein n=1 Tax=Ureibacillus thermophilus TaxID=367743 RepID=A0A4P6UXZ2_9BACL|nr:prepilin-type N-terminal cleavage/methylation domain-containing protein [Ureibacillus thermophilus]
MKKRLKNEKGLTLVELLAVIVILAIVAAIAIPAIGNIIENSRYNAVKADAINVLNAANLYFTENNGETTVTVKKLKEDGFLDSEGKIPTDSTITKAKGGHKLKASDITYSGNKKVTFNDATIQAINADNQEGSTEGDKTIPQGTQTPSQGTQ